MTPMPQPVAAKICGIKDPVSLDAAIAGDARWVGDVFFPKSPRHIAFDVAASLVNQGRGRVESMALLVNPDDDLVKQVVDRVNPDWLQLHGQEEPARVAQLRAATGKKIVKAFGISHRSDLDKIEPWLDVCDMLLFDAKPPKGSDLPGGNATSFDWTILRDFDLRNSWMLSGGLDPDNVIEAITISGATCVDISSGVESSRGVKDPEKITTFLANVRAAGQPVDALATGGLVL